MKNTMLLFPLLAMLVSGCAMQQDRFPSLSKRPIENVPAGGSQPLAEADAVTSLPPALQQDVDAAVRQSDQAHRNFLAELPEVEMAVANGRDAEPSSESWVAAQMQLSALEAQRSPSISALADLDALYVRRLDREFDDSEPGGAALIDRSRKMVVDQVEMQQRKIDALKAALR